jgi:hypothetical protein
MEKDNCSSDQVKRDGSAQKKRYLDALHPENNPVDGRSIEDLLVFAKHYASLLRFYDLNENKNQQNITPLPVNPPQKQNDANDQQKPNKNYDSWKEFFYSDISVVLASIKVFGKKLAHVKKEYEDKRAQLDANPVKDNFRELFIINVHHLQRINRWYQRSIPNHPLQYELGVKIQSSLAPALRKLIAYDQGAKVNLEDDMNIMALYDVFKNPPWEADYNHIKLDATIYTGQDDKSKIKHAALYIDDIFQEIYKAYTQLYESSDAWLSNSLNNFPEHQPHMALFICFIELFQLAQNEINTLTQKHLDFYYRDVLQLKERPANPDSVYLIYELAKGFDDYTLEKGTPLTAGKDLTGKELIYKTDSDLVINKAIVKELKTIFLDKQILEASKSKTDLTEADYEIKNIYAASVANSADGKGEKFTEAETAWNGFGYFKPKIENNVIINEVGTEAQIGFAIASPQLFLAEGERLIRLSFQVINDKNENFTIPKNFEDSIKICLTSEKGWIEVPKAELFDSGTKDKISVSGFFIGEGTEEKNKKNTIYINLTPSDSSISSYNKNIHLGNYDTSYPVLKIILFDSSQFEVFKNIAVGDDGSLISIDVTVGNIGINQSSNISSLPESGVKNLNLENDDTTLNSNKPFYPFAILPKTGSSFFISSEEVFNKKLSNLKINIEWMGLPDVSFPTYYTQYNNNGLAISLNNDFAVISNLVFENLSTNIQTDDKIKIPSSSNKFFDFLFETITGDTANKPSSFRTLNYSLNGVVPRKILENNDSSSNRKLQLTLSPKEFGHSFYSTIILKATNKEQIPNPPYTPQIKTISLSYESNQEFMGGEDQFFHIYPFGMVEVFPIEKSNENGISIFDDLDKGKDNLLIKTNKLLPQFKFGLFQINADNKAVQEALEKNYFSLNQYTFQIQQQGNLYIGIEDLIPPQNLSLLFKIADGTADDNDSDPPLIHWSYLVNNEWRPLAEDHVISDSTYGLQTTGIVLIDFPEDATKNNTIITPGLHWLCISIDKNGGRFPKIIDVIAQANSARFFDLSNTDPIQQNDPEHYRNPLPAETISKLVTKVAEVKKITQPFESFDNRMREEREVFYPRVSERLRHKARAVTPWDYEHLVLENFPAVYKVKCITHSDPECGCRKYEDAGGSKKCCCNQVAPGHVLIVPVSNLRNKSAVNVLKPRTGRRTMIKIKEFLQRRVSPFVNIHVHNPLFEEVKVFFNVKFMSGVDKGSNLKRLNKDLIRHLTPWAFDASSELVFSGKIYASNVINFIEERSYVDYITCFKMIHIKDDCCEPENYKDITCAEMKLMPGTGIKNKNVMEIEPSSPYAILVSAEQHCINLIEEKPVDDPCKKIL